MLGLKLPVRKKQNKLNITRLDDEGKPEDDAFHLSTFIMPDTDSVRLEV